MSKRFTYNLSLVSILLMATQVLLWASLLFGIWFAQSNYEQFRLEREDQLLYAVIVFPIMVIHLLYLRWQNKGKLKFAEHHLLQHSFKPISNAKTFVKLFCLYSALAFAFVAYLNPQFGTKEKTSDVKGIDIIVALDVSNSMLAKDLDKDKSRLEIAKRALEQLTKNLHGDRIGIVVFAGKAFTQLPITTDYSAAKLFLSSISTNMIRTQGTAIGNAIEVAMNSFDFEADTKKSIIIITDGENHEDNAIDETKNAAKQGVIVHTIGLGNVNGVPIPMYKNGKFINNKRDKNGNTVLTKLNEAMLKEIADEGNGIYIKAQKNNLGLPILLDELSNLEKSAYDTKQYQEYEDQFQWFLFLAILLLIPYIVLNEIRIKL